MSKTVVPKNYKSVLTLYQTQDAIDLIHRTFEPLLSKKLNLKRVSAPLFVVANKGINDDLNGVERPVKFSCKENDSISLEVVQSLAKWKRIALKKYDFYPGKGLYTDMNAIRRDETLDNLHSIYVDQWDWEKVINFEDRNFLYLEKVVTDIVDCIVETSKILSEKYPELDLNLNNEVHFVSSEDLLKFYPNKDSKEREYLITKKYKTVFITQVGKKLSDNSVHDNRSPDYDDWELNGDLLIYSEILDTPIEISSMGIRVTKDSLYAQLKESNNLQREKLYYHQLVLNDELPFTIGGGIGQSRLSMLLLKKAHIGEVQASYWDDQTIKICKENGIELL